jgi:protein-disulfide isomerase
MAKMTVRVCVLGLILCGLVLGARGQQAAAPAPGASGTAQQKKVEDFLRRYFALGPEVGVTVGTAKELNGSGILEVPITVKPPEGQAEEVKMFMSKDGRYLVRGEITDLTTDPLAETAKKIDLTGAAVYGDSQAQITLVEFSDFECPVCRALHDALRGMLPNYPQVKVVFKDFPIESVHPWARQAALAGRCALAQDPKAFWKMYDLIYDNQELVSAANAWDKMLEFAGRAGLNQDAFKACMTSPEATAQVDASLKNGALLDVHSTPTVFVNGRRVIGADAQTIRQYLDYEVAQLAGGKK